MSTTTITMTATASLRDGNQQKTARDCGGGRSSTDDDDAPPLGRPTQQSTVGAAVKGRQAGAR